MKFHNLQKLKPGMLVRLERPAHNGGAVYGVEYIPKTTPPKEGRRLFFEIKAPSVAIFLKVSDPLLDINDWVRGRKFVQVLVEEHVLWFDTSVVFNFHEKWQHYDPEK